MGLVSEKVKFKLCNNYKYWENKGYTIPYVKSKRRDALIVPKGTMLEVYVKDLPKGSGQLVEVQCDNCNKIYSIPYNAYVNRNHNGKIYCKNCSSTILNSGENNGNYNPNLTDEERIIGRNYKEYYDFIKKVQIRDDYTCKCCGKRGGHDLEVHHLNGYDWCKEGRVDVKNGILLCKKCHKNFHSIYGKGANTKEQFDKWLGQVVKNIDSNQELFSARQVYCIEDNKLYTGGALQIAKEWGCSFSVVYDICNLKENSKGNISKSLYGKHLIWYDKYIQMTKEDIELFLNWCNKRKKIKKTGKNSKSKKVICLTTFEEFDSPTIASKAYKIQASNIRKCCDGERNYCGKINDLKLKWAWKKNVCNDVSTTMTFYDLRKDTGMEEIFDGIDYDE